MGVNRDRTKRPKRVKIWCSSCDRAKVQPDTKCPVCGSRETNYKRRFKKAVLPQASLQHKQT